MSAKYWSAKYCLERTTRNNKERLQKKFVKDIKVVLKKIKKKSNNMIVNDTKSYQKMKKKSWLSIEKKCYKMKKTPYYNCMKLWLFFRFG